MKLWKLKFFIGQHDEDGFYCFVFAKNAEEARKIAEEKIFAYCEKRFASTVEVKIGDKARLLCTCLEDDLGEEEKENNLKKED